MPAKSVHLRIDLQVGHPLGTRLIGFFKSSKRVVGPAKRGVHGGSIIAANKVRRLFGDGSYTGGRGGVVRRKSLCSRQRQSSPWARYCF